MKEKYILEGLACPHCAALIEQEVGQVENVSEASVNLMKQTLNVSYADEIESEIFSKIEKIVHSHEPDVNVFKSNAHKRPKDNSDNKKRVIKLVSGAIIYAIALLIMNFASFKINVGLIILCLAYFILGADVLWRAIKNIINGKVFDENFLMALSTVGAFIIGEYPEAVAVMLFYQIGEFFQDLAVNKSRKSISDLMDIRPDVAYIKDGDDIKEVSPETIRVGQEILVRPGEKIPLDGTIIDGASTLDTMALTGESLPRSVSVGDKVLSGCINQVGAITIKVEKEFGESTASKVIDLVENATENKTKSEIFITKFARYYTPIVVFAALILSFVPPLILNEPVSDWIYRGFVFLVISCPCALVISVPLTFFGGLGTASKYGVLIKGSNYLDVLANLENVVFDKTGTLTKGVFKVTNLLLAKNSSFSQDELLSFAAQAEIFSTHPIAKSIVSAYKEKIAHEIDTDAIKNYTEISGKGVSVECDSKRILAGSYKLMEDNGISYEKDESAAAKVYVAIDGEFVGCVLISDELKADSKAAIKGIKAMGIKQVAMLTGDDEKIASSVANELGLDKYYSNLLPSDKVEKIEEIIKETNDIKRSTAFVGDGINDAPVLARADVGIAMGALGSDAAIEAADVVLMNDNPKSIISALKIAKKTRRIATQNIVFALTVKGIILVLGALGLAGMWLAIFGDVGVMIIAVLNAMRMLKVNMK